MITSKTKLIGIFGYPLGHTLSPLMHNKTLAKMGLNYIYIPLEVKPDDIGRAVDAIRVFDMLGVNVTIPYKEKVIKYLDYLSPEAKACGAVNLIKNENGYLTGYNTDGAGFIAGLKEANIDYKGNTLLLGAGGAARAVSYALASEGAKSLTFLNRDKVQAEKLANFINEQTNVSCHAFEMNLEIFNDIASNIDMIINCTPVGMYPNINETPVKDINNIKKGAVFCDLIYNPLKTKFLAMGEAKGYKTINGLPMFIHQGALTLKILTNINPPTAFMEEVVLHQMA